MPQKKLKEVGLNVVDISPNGDFTANRWFTPQQVAIYFPTYFDATSGHLSIELMRLIGKAFRYELGDLPDINYVPCGSGETLVCLKLAYPEKKFIAVYNLDLATKYDEYCILNDVVKLFAEDIIGVP